jgi:hypothetical protein
VVPGQNQDMVNYAIEEYVALLADERFKDLDYTVIKAHVSFLNDITLDQLMSAVQKHKVFFLHMTKFCQVLMFLTILFLYGIIGENSRTQVLQAESQECRTLPLQV